MAFAQTQPPVRRRARLDPLALAVAVVAAWVAGNGVQAGDGTSVNFNRDIKPILSNNCFTCHGPDAAERQGGTAGLRLDTPDGADGALADLGGHAAIVPGEPGRSALIERITTADADLRMPPAGTGKQLSPREIELLTEWIRAGGQYSRHWSYEPPVRPAAPRVAQADWPRSDLDRFVLSRLDREGLAPSPEADRYSLIRRAALDLTGLPPTLAEVDAFVADESADAYERMIDRMLAKEAYGEHLARMWLDLARYADSAGYADDPPRTIWAYRDYVIRAFNANRRFDEFTIEQIAGDLLPSPTEDQLIATAFHRNTLTNNEGGTSDEEFRNVAVVDRVNTTMAVWMGTTMACAQCHSHKYDPLTQDEYFQLFAFFNSSADSDQKDESPFLELFTPEQIRQRTEWEARIAQLEDTLRTPTPELAAAEAAWSAEMLNEPEWTVLHPSALSAETEAGLSADSHGVISAATATDTNVYTVRALIAKPQALSGVRIETLVDAGQDGAGFADGRFVITRVRAEVGPRDLPFAAALADIAPPGHEPGLVLDAPETDSTGWGSGGLSDQPHALTLIPAVVETLPAGSELSITIEQRFPTVQHTLRRFRVLLTDDPRAREYAAAPADVIAILRTPADQRDESQQARLSEHYRSIAPLLAPQRDELAAVRKQLAELKPHTTVPVMRELPDSGRRVTQLHVRGNYQQTSGPELSPGVPAAFPPLPEGVAANRLALAQWLVARDNPLTARVMVNRLWEKLFGEGLVRSSEEFGSQGDQPTHPELLDWLAVEFMESGWDVKGMLRLLTTSATYRQSSRVTPQLLERDSDNMLLARGPRVRLTAETIRDQALAAGGLLSSKVGGAPVQPQQPDIGLNAAFGSKIDWQTSEGEDRYRRGLYTSWRRSNPYPSMATFDAPNREVCTLRRARTNTPLQALVTLNDPVFVEAAQGLARRMLAHEGDVAERANYGLRLCLARPATESERTRLAELYETARAELAAAPDRAATLATSASSAKPEEDPVELAAWTVMGNVLLNLDEIFMKR